MRIATPKNSGFTLIELMISAAVASIILVASYACLNAGVASQKIIEPRTEILQSARVAMSVMAADLRSACKLDPDFDFVGETRTIGEMEADNLDFATHHYMPRRLNEGDYCQVSYFISKSRDGKSFSLWRRHNPRIAPDSLSGGIRDEIVSGVAGLTLEYYDGLDWYDTWGDANVDKKKKYTSEDPPNMTGFPQAVRITLLLDAEPPSDKTAAKASDKAKTVPPFAFQTVVRIEMASASQSGSSDNMSAPQGQGGAN